MTLIRRRVNNRTFSVTLRTGFLSLKHTERSSLRRCNLTFAVTIRARFGRSTGSGTAAVTFVADLYSAVCDITLTALCRLFKRYGNSTIWPLCHYFFSYTQYRQNFWETYREVNRLFCEEVRHLVGSDDIVWVQDYQLMLLPGTTFTALWN